MRSRMTLAGCLLAVLLLGAACGAAGADQAELGRALDELSAQVDRVEGQVSTLAESADGLDARVSGLEASAQALRFDASRVGPSRAQYLPNPPDGQVTVQFLALDVNDALPGEFTFHLAPEGASLFETESVAKDAEVEVGPQIADGIAFVEPGKFYLLQVVYRNPEKREVKFLVPGGVLDPQAALPFVRNRCWCAAVPFSAPAEGAFSRMIEVGVGPDTPPGAKAIVVWPVVKLSQ